MARKLVSKAKSDWEDGAKAAASTWEQRFSSSDTLNEWADGIQESSGGRVSAAQVKASLGGSRFQNAQRDANADDYSRGVAKVVDGKSRADKWEENWIDAWKKA
jgi:hypothetical protein